ncbi:hypothetical protein [Mucilaginibacter sp. KACC 22063]|uniref:hypothetical protein n=1 Tax=Mucilaginibacter sp. KACC 22063 TaxID=3025666 RepID=UPI002366B4DB|nr:hypothetical protein [Mucilaginibacter sp. KACC 22063]WDF55582.1 hypothetical protein PQ461_00735 [Mucilaginibacter sp. KACC 22063]
MAKPASKPAKQIVKHQQEVEHTDQMAFVKYLDDGDYFQLLAKKNDTTDVFINETDTTRNLNWGDLIKVTWKNGTVTVPGDNDSEMPAKLLLSVKRIGDGSVSKLRESYGKKLKYTFSPGDNFTSSYLDKVYLSVEYYLATTKNPLLQIAIKDRQEVTYSIESRDRDNRSYRVIGIAAVGPNGSNVVQWLYIDEERDQIYEYDLPADKLVPYD